ncbi:hypothetical protein B566_EDAN016092 [Ephemera danica]|nr:hypothetical protein B566_EDAN016092 [Ephemera danica]
MVSNLEAPGVYVKHVCYTNFIKYGFPDPIYMNIVRDPVERVISWYYYIRAPWYYVERKRAFPDLPLPDPNWLKKDFETCVLRGDRECRYIEGETREGIGDHRQFFGSNYVDLCAGEGVNSINRNLYKPPVSEAVKDIVRANFTRETEFYQFCKQRLHRQYRALNLV